MSISMDNSVFLDMYDCEKCTYNDIWKSILSNIIRYGKAVFIDGKGKHSSGDTIELSDMIIILKNPKLPSNDDINLIPPLGKKFINNMLILRDSIQYDRLFENKQIFNIIERIKNNETTRRAVFTVFLPEDILSEYGVPTVSGQFLVRDKKLSLRVFMRSNDAYNGFLGNIFGFINLLYFVAKETGTKPDIYIHYVTSMHIYKVDLKKINHVIWG